MYNDEEYEGLGHYDSDASDESYDWSSHDEAPLAPIVHTYDALTPVINENIPVVLLAADISTTMTMCSINKRFHHLCQLPGFWYLKLEYHYPGYTLYFKKATSYLEKIIYKDMAYNARDYYTIYSAFRHCLNTMSEVDAIYINDKKKLPSHEYHDKITEYNNKIYSVADAISIMYNHDPPSSIMFKLLSLILPYAKKNVVSLHNLNNLTNKFVHALTNHGHEEFSRYKYIESIKGDALRWKLIKCITQMYYNYT